MAATRESAGKTRRLRTPSIVDLDPSALCVFSAATTEPRARAPLWDALLAERRRNCVEIIETNPMQVIVRMADRTESVTLNDDNQLGALFSGFNSGYIDISGLPHHVWAPLIRVAFQRLNVVWAIYAEPKTYRKHPSPTSQAEFDLSDSFRGIEPIPGFARLSGPEDEKEAVFVALLGFEGTRARLLASALDPVPKVFAVVGVPGFRIEYPQITLMSNNEFLTEHRAHAEIRYAVASCPFGVFDVLKELHRDCSGRYMYIAPIGTKPHALGAICYALRNPSNTELMYDHPNRKPGRTDGIGLLHIYTIKPSYVAT